MSASTVSMLASPRHTLMSSGRGKTPRVNSWTGVVCYAARKNRTIVTGGSLQNISKSIGVMYAVAFDRAAAVGAVSNGPVFAEQHRQAVVRRPPKLGPRIPVSREERGTPPSRIIQGEPISLS